MPLLWEEHPRVDPTIQAKIVDQIWMPGVHADIGGCSDGVLIGNLAALTMIEHLEARCPEIGFDTGFIHRLESITFNPDLIVEITNERPGFWRKILHKEDRSAVGGFNQYKHYLLSQLTGRVAMQRGKNKMYCANHITKHIPRQRVIPTKYKAQIDSLFQGSLQNQCCGFCH